MSFRSKLVNRFKSCLVTRFHATECDAAHIIPRWVVSQLNPNLVSDSANGLLLAKSLHITFDQYLWTFDVFGSELITEGKLARKWAYVPIYVRNNRNKRLVNQYHQSYFKLPVTSLPHLWLHHQLFLKVNYECELASVDHNTEIPLEIYQELMNSPDYQTLLTDPCQLFCITLKKEEREPQVIINHRGFGAEYLIARKYSSLFEADWLPDYQLPEKLVNEYQELRNYRQ